jgi:hypothetical protein
MIMKLKLFVPALALVFISGAASAQISLGAQAGAVFAKSKTDQLGGLPGIDLSTKNRVGFTAGAIADIPFGESGLRLMPELNFVQKGVKANGNVNFDLLGQIVNADVDATVNLNYIELPVNLAYAVEAGPGRFIVGAGPYAAFGLNGKTNAKVSFQGQSQEEDEDIEFGSDDDQIKRVDFGANFMAGYIMNNGLLFKVNYSLGLANLSNVNDSDWKNRYFGVSVGYFFLRGGE